MTKSSFVAPDIIIRQAAHRALSALLPSPPAIESLSPTLTRKEFAGDYSIVVFPFTKQAGMAPEALAKAIGEHILTDEPAIAAFNVVKGFLNLSFTDHYRMELLQHGGAVKMSLPPRKVVLEFCGPNTNKPLHLGHMRNMCLGDAMYRILEAAGATVHPVNIYNDRGIAICKSMLAWLKDEQRPTPESTGKKGDHLVGDLYVAYNELYAAEVEALAKDMPKEEAEKAAPILKEARDMLLKWEANDPEVRALWERMNQWVYAGFEQTYAKLGISFERHYYESEQYLSGKALVQEGLKSGAFFEKDDGSVWVDLTEKNLDEKVLLRSDGTSVYLTQDLGTAEARWNDYGMDESIYVVADEQDYHFKVLKCTLEVLGKPYAAGIHHLSYGMVELPSGKMKSRLGTTVDADDLMQLMQDTAEAMTRELGKIDDFSSEEALELYNIIGLGALKFYLLKVGPRKKILFDPEASIDFHGDTGPLIQYTHARICSVLRAAGQVAEVSTDLELADIERELWLTISRYPVVVAESAAQYDPSHLATYLLHLARVFNRFYAEQSILKADGPVRDLRLNLCQATASKLKEGMALLGIRVPERM